MFTLSRGLLFVPFSFFLFQTIDELVDVPMLNGMMVRCQIFYVICWVIYVMKIYQPCFEQNVMRTKGQRGSKEVVSLQDPLREKNSKSLILWAEMRVWCLFYDICVSLVAGKIFLKWGKSPTSSFDAHIQFYCEVQVSSYDISSTM
jgi:hypothetical protein